MKHKTFNLFSLFYVAKNIIKAIFPFHIQKALLNLESWTESIKRWYCIFCNLQWYHYSVIYFCCRVLRRTCPKTTPSNCAPFSWRLSCSRICAISSPRSTRAAATVLPCWMQRRKGSTSPRIRPRRGSSPSRTTFREISGKGGQLNPLQNNVHLWLK